MIGVFVAILAVGIWASNSRLAGERGWVYNRYNPKPRGGGTLGLLEEIYQPSIRYVIEERSDQAARGGQDESGDKPDPGTE
jgi:hypothetical protein